MTEQAYRAKRVLRNLRQLDAEIKEKKERLANLMASATRATASIEAERISGTGERSRLESTMVKKIDLEAQLRDGTARLEEERFAIQNALDAMQDSRERRLLTHRYVDGRSWVAIQMRMEISETWCRAIEASALEHFAEIFF